MPDSLSGITEPRMDPRRLRAFAGVGMRLALLGALVACWDRDFRFESAATYRAPLNGLILEGVSEGRVLAGRDLSSDYQGRFRLRPNEGSAGIEILLSSAQPRQCRVVGRRQPLPWTSFAAGKSLGQALAEAGIEVRAPKELEELADAMDGLVMGPKGTTMKGQTDVLEVVEVRLDYPLR